MLSDPQFLAVALFAVTLSGLSKGGFSGMGMLATPMLSLLVPPVVAASIMLPILSLQDIISMVIYRRHVDWRLVASMTPGALLGILAGYLFAANLPQEAVALALGLISVIFSVRGLTRKRLDDAAPKPRNPIAATVSGAAAGLTSMISHAGAPPYQIYVLPLKLSRDVFVGTTVVFFGMMNWVKMVPYAMLGQFDKSVLGTSLLLFPWAVISGFFGIWLVRRTDPKAFEKIIYALLGMVGLLLIHDGASAFL